MSELLRMHCYAHSEPLLYTCGRWTNVPSLEALAILAHKDLTPRHVLLNELPRGLERNGYRPLNAEEERTLRALLG